MRGKSQHHNESAPLELYRWFHTIDLMKGLFQKKTSSPAIVRVAVAANVHRQYDYLWQDGWRSPARSMRVRVPFGKGNRKVLAFVTEINPPETSTELKTVVELIDSEALFDEKLWQLGLWISRYYLAPLGMVLSAMVPSVVGKVSGKTETVASLTCSPRDWPRSLGPAQKRLLNELFQAKRQGVEPVVVEQLLSHADASRDSINRLVKRGLIHLETRPVSIASLDDKIEPDPFDLNDDQKKVLSVIESRLDGHFCVMLLHGVTASGKTEVYLRAIRKVIEGGKQAILLVPEIALATQTLQRLARRLPRVAVLHSGLTPAERAFYYEQIRNGSASTVIGPRSAIFAPTGKLGLIIVDEEHESSYKQETIPRYHGRDVAIKRASIENVPVLLGSATPSLESLYNARIGKYELLELPRRIYSLPMPRLHLVELRKEITPGRVELIGRTLGEKIAQTLDRNEQVILLMNRRGYASFVFCPSCHWQLQCDRCSRPMVFHRAIGLAMCHYCNMTKSIPPRCPACGGKLLLFGLGIQRIEAELARKFPTAVVSRMDSDTMSSPRQFRLVFDNFASGQVDILLGTQMVAKGLDFPRVTLVGIVSADTALWIPDFRAAERTFQMIVQVAGRAGRAQLPADESGTSRTGEVIVQTLHPSDPAIRLALEHDYSGFVHYELKHRKEMDLPPFSRLVRFIIRHGKLPRAEAAADVFAREVRELFHGDGAVRIIGPMRAGVFKIRGKFRFELNCFSRKPGYIQGVLAERITQMERKAGAEIIIDADPVNLV